jgi:hypothetical protein
MMDAVSEVNRQRYRAILISRDVKRVLCMVPEIFGTEPRQLWRWLFLGHDGKPHRAGEIILADLRRYARLDTASIFDSDPQVLAYREGKRAAAMRIFNYLNLDEKAVQTLMELDDGL